MLKGTARWLASGYDWPLYRDWLAYLGLAIIAVVTVFRVRADGPWDLLGVPFGFAIVGWILGGVREWFRGYRGEPTAQ